LVASFTLHNKTHGSCLVYLTVDFMSKSQHKTLQYVTSHQYLEKI